MYFKVSWDEEFDTLMMHLYGKYGRELFTIDGVGDQMDLNKFAKNFFTNKNATADVSVDANANVTSKTSVEYNFEMSKPFTRYNSYFLLWKELRKNYGLLVANRIIELQLTGSIYINDFVDVARPYCFNYSTYDIYCNGLDGVSSRLHIGAPQNLSTFLRQVEQFMVVAANSTLGATGFADLLIVASKYVDKILETGKDGHVEIGNPNEYVKQKLTEFIYTVNWEYRGNQSPFTNVSLFDDTFLDSLCPDYDANKETVKMLQKIYTEIMNEEMRRTPLTFPVTTACFCVDENREIKDKEFLKFIAEADKEFGFINMYNGNTSTLSSCCRLRSNTDNPYFNSFGAGQSKIGSLGVVTANLPRVAYAAKGNYNKFLADVKDLFDVARRVNSCKRKIISKRIESGAAPLYTLGFMDLSKQYSTFGLVGINEAVQLLGYDILTKEGQDIVVDLLNHINIWIDEAEKKEKAPHNIESIPAESSAAKLAKKDRYLGYNINVALYSNQFIPLTTKADMFDRLNLQGLFDSKFSGGAIAHINIGSKIEDTDTIVHLIEYAAKQGVVYWALNMKLYCCPNKHTWVGTEHCPMCGNHWESEISRVVGFFTSIKNWIPVRREYDWPNRQFYNEDDIKVENVKCKVD